MQLRNLIQPLIKITLDRGDWTSCWYDNWADSGSIHLLAKYGIFEKEGIKVGDMYIVRWKRNVQVLFTTMDRMGIVDAIFWTGWTPWYGGRM